jgi:hypothetical protein
MWGPEFLGVAAVLHERQTSRHDFALPSSVINLDMVGENQSLCGCPFLIERPPEWHVDRLAVLAEHLVAETFAQTREGDDAWRAAPFMGFSDHALFADPSIGRPAVQFCHAPDRFNHSAADTLDKVSPTELRRATGAASALAGCMSSPTRLEKALLQVAVREFGARECAAAEEAAARHANVGEGRWSRELVRRVRAATVRLESTLSRNDWAPAPIDDRDHGRTRLRRQWDGPFNVRAMMGDLSASTRSALAALFRERKYNHALLFNFAIRVDGQRSREQIVADTSFAHRHPIEPAVAARLIDALVESGWASEAAQGDDVGD